MTWGKEKLGDVCDIVNGGTPDSKVAKFWGGENLWITPKDMGRLTDKYVAATERKITNEGLSNSSAKLLPPNSIILSSRAPIGHLAINTKPMATNQGCKGLVPHKNLHYLYLYYFLYDSKQLLNELGSGTTFKEISGSKLASVEIPLPTMETQLEIVKKLEKYFSEIDAALVAIDSKQKAVIQLRKALLHESLTENS
jgi:type I restriction enzyme S subunit